MRHRQSGRQLNRNASSRKALFKSLSIALITHGQIKTTLAKAKELRRVVEPLITLTKGKDLIHARRLAYSRLGSRQAVLTLFNDIAPKFADRPGGYLRVIKCGFRDGDAAPMAIVQLVEEEDEGSSD